MDGVQELRIDQVTHLVVIRIPARVPLGTYPKFSASHSRWPQLERAPFDEWLAALRDVQARARIRARLARVQAGNFGDFKPLQGSRPA